MIAEAKSPPKGYYSFLVAYSEILTAFCLHIVTLMAIYTWNEKLLFILVSSSSTVCHSLTVTPFDPKCLCCGILTQVGWYMRAWNFSCIKPHVVFLQICRVFVVWDISSVINPIEMLCIMERFHIHVCAINKLFLVQEKNKNNNNSEGMKNDVWIIKVIVYKGVLSQDWVAKTQT